MTDHSPGRAPARPLRGSECLAPGNGNSIPRVRELRSGSGSYALLVRNGQTAEIGYGRDHILAARAGYYVYIGSAFGPGGIRARVERHARTDKSLHWHIDRLTVAARVLGALVNYDERRREHEWASVFGNLADFEPVSGFGCTDCRCESHLFYTARKRDVTAAWSRLPGRLVSWTRPRGR